MTKIRSLTQPYSCHFLEWVEYHIKMGVDQIIVNDECSVDPIFKEALQYYKTLGIVTIANEHSRIYRNCSNYVRNEMHVMKETFDIHHRKCEWTTMIDADEYLTLLDGGPGLPLLELLIHKTPFVRMPWFTVGSESREKCPVGLTIENYKHGKLHGQIKTIAKSSEVGWWSTAHHPWVKHRDKYIIHNGKKMSLQHYVEENNIRSEEHPRIAHLVDANYTTNSNEVFLKHYVYLSWEEYTTQRAQYKVNADGRANIWAVNARQNWLVGATYKDVLAVNFTQSMAVKVRSALTTRRASATNSTNTIFDRCAPLWGI